MRHDVDDDDDEVVFLGEYGIVMALLENVHLKAKQRKALKSDAYVPGAGGRRVILLFLTVRVYC